MTNTSQIIAESEIVVTYTELTLEQEQAIFNFFESRSFPRIIQRLEEEEK
ncbi:hypothetical protein [Listeria seeligeri]|nr:hypothetical protein [Listeria seeligeri]